jgi:hypothetical protein
MSSVANGPQGLQHYIANSTSNAHKKACAVSCRICSLATGSQGLGRWIALSTYKTQGEGRRSLMQNMLSGDRATRTAALECKFYIHDTQKACATSCRIFSKATGPQGPRHQISIFTNNTHTHTRRACAGTCRVFFAATGRHIQKAYAVSCRICALATGTQGLWRWIALSTYKHTEKAGAA